MTGPALEAFLHRFGNIVLWLNGHRHLNDVQPRPDRNGRTNGFWEVSTAAMADWPCQSRLVEVVASGASEIAILCTMVDSGVPADPDRAEGRERLAALHRELASNNPFAGAGFGQGGTTARLGTLPSAFLPRSCSGNHPRTRAVGDLFIQPGPTPYIGVT